MEGAFDGLLLSVISPKQDIGANLPNYKSYPRIVGETGGKDFLVAHNSSDIDALVTAMIRGAFEYAGQKCSALSRAYIPERCAATVCDAALTTV